MVPLDELNKIREFTLHIGDTFIYDGVFLNGEKLEGMLWEIHFLSDYMSEYELIVVNKGDLNFCFRVVVTCHYNDIKYDKEFTQHCNLIKDRLRVIRKKEVDFFSFRNYNNKRNKKAIFIKRMILTEKVYEKSSTN